MAGDQEQYHVITIEERFRELKSAGNYDIMSNCNTGKVPLVMRNHPKLSKYFEPSFVSFGPIHHGNPKYQSAEKYKLRLANYFVNDSGKDAAFFYQKVIVDNDWPGLMQYYLDEEVAGKFNHEQELAWMLFVDGCAVLQSIFCVVHQTFGELNMEHDMMALWEKDLFLLENQLPYQLLEDLMDSSAMKDELRKCIKAFIYKHSVTLRSHYNQKDHQPQPQERAELAHLLHYLWQILVGLNQYKTHDLRADNNSTTEGYRAAGRRQSVPWNHNVRELKTAGINVKPCTSKTGSLTAIDFFCKLFNFRPGYLSLPPIVVDHTTGFKLINLIAYEMTRPGMFNYDGVTSYVLFLGSILDELGDVQQLTEARVLHNLLDKDEQVFQLFNDISTNLVAFQNYEFHVNVKRQIEQHYGNKLRIWMARLFQQTNEDLFSRPWKILTFFASFSALLLTAIQSLYPILYPSGHGDDQVRKKFH